MTHTPLHLCRSRHKPGPGKLFVSADAREVRRGRHVVGDGIIKEAALRGGRAPGEVSFRPPTSSQEETKFVGVVLVPIVEADGP